MSLLPLSAVVCLAAGAPRAAGQQAPVFKGGIELVHIGVTVTDRKDQLVTSLTADDFEIVEDGKKQTIRYFAPGVPSGGDAAPLHLGLLLDVSGSMDEAMSFTKTAAVKFVNTLRDAVDVTVVSFDTAVRVTRYSQNEHPRLVERIRQLKAVGWTALYDAIGVYLDGAAEQDGRKIMLLYSDGFDTTSALNFRELVDLLKASDVTVYPIGELDHVSQFARLDARRTLSLIARTTGGQAFFPLSPKELDSIYDKVVAEIRAQYTIGYVSSNEAADGTWREVEVRIAGKPSRDYRIRSRPGYFAPYRNP
jgi:Ca-activated chloride channel family protein